MDKAQSSSVRIVGEDTEDSTSGGEHLANCFTLLLRR